MIRYLDTFNDTIGSALPSVPPARLTDSDKQLLANAVRRLADDGRIATAAQLSGLRDRLIGLQEEPRLGPRASTATGLRG